MAAADPFVDEAQLRVFRDDYPELADELADLFADSTPPMLEELRDALRADDDDALRRAAHKLKGSCLTIGATFMAAVARSVEEGAGAIPLDGLDELEAAFEPTYEAIRRALSP